MSFTLRGKPLSVTEVMLTGAGGADLLTPLRAGDVARTRELLMWMDFVVRLFWPVTEILRDSADGYTFFSFTAYRIGAMINVENQPPSVVADFVHHRMRALQDAFKRFYAGQLLLRPVYSSSFLTGPDALAALAELSRMQQSTALNVPQLATSVAAQLHQLGWVPPPGSGPAPAPAPAAAAGLPLAPAPALPKPPKRPRTRPKPAPAAAAPAVAAVAVAPIVGAAAAAVPAPVVAAVTIPWVCSTRQPTWARRLASLWLPSRRLTLMRLVRLVASTSGAVARAAAARCAASRTCDLLHARSRGLCSSCACSAVVGRRLLASNLCIASTASRMRRLCLHDIRAIGNQPFVFVSCDSVAS